MADEKKPEYFHKLITLVVDLGTEGLRKVFEKHIPAEYTIETYLNNQKSTITTHIKSFNQEQLNIINATNPDKSKIDISLLSVLIPLLTNVQSPNGGWKNKHPTPSDQSPGAYIMRLKLVRNTVVAHRSLCALTKSEFEEHWAETEKCLLGLAGYIGGETERKAVKQKIEETKSKDVLASPQNRYEYLLQMLIKWYKDDKETEKHLAELENKVDDMSGQVDQISAEMDGIRRGQEQINKRLDINEASSKQNDGRSERAHAAEPPIDYPNALTDKDIEEYSGKLGKDPCKDWEIFGVLLGFKQTQLDELQTVYRRKREIGYHAMLQKWHRVVAVHEKNPRGLLAAAFLGIHDKGTAEKILGGEELEGVKRLKPNPGTEKEIQDITFQDC